MAILTNELPLSYPRNHVSNGNLHIRQIQVSLQYSRDQLKRFRRHSIIDTMLIAVLKDNDIFRYRGKRSGKRVKELQDLRSQRRWENLNCLNRSHLHSDVNNARAFSSRPCVQPKASIPSLLISNTRSLTCKVDELECVARQNNADVICVTESWLTKDIPVLGIAMSDFMVFRKDRSVSCGGGLAVYVNSTIRCKSLSQFANPGNVSECLWLQLRPRRLPRSVSSVLLAVIYHPPYATAQDNNDLYNHVQATVDLYSLEHPECLICVVGDFNPNSTNISPAPFKRMCGLTQIVKVFTRDTGILDWCLTNSPKVFSLSMQLPKIGASDHYSVLVAPVIPSSHSSKLTLLRRDTRPSHIRDFGGWITSFVWDDLYALDSCEEKFKYFYQNLHEAVECFLPV